MVVSVLVNQAGPGHRPGHLRAIAVKLLARSLARFWPRPASRPLHNAWQGSRNCLSDLAARILMWWGCESCHVLWPAARDWVLACVIYLRRCNHSFCFFFSFFFFLFPSNNLDYHCFRLWFCNGGCMIDSLCSFGLFLIGVRLGFYPTAIPLTLCLHWGKRGKTLQ